MKKDLFERKFKEAIVSYPNKHGHKFRTAMGNIAKIVGNSFSDQKWTDRKWNLDPKTEKELSNALAICKDYEYDYNAMYNIIKYVFEAQHGSINTVNCPTLENFKNEMKYHLKKLPNGGFIYIAWRLSPLFVNYIGKTERSGGARILDLHKNLHLAVGRGPTRSTYFTIIYPNSKNDIKNVEASFIRIMKKLRIKQKYKILNKKDERFKFPCYSGISALEKFFDQIKKVVKRYRYN